MTRRSEAKVEERALNILQPLLLRREFVANADHARVLRDVSGAAGSSVRRAKPQALEQQPLQLRDERVKEVVVDGEGYVVDDALAIGSTIVVSSDTTVVWVLWGGRTLYATWKYARTSAITCSSSS